MATFIEHFLNGLLLGGIFALVAVGYSLVYGIIKLINFAHGEVAMFGAFFCLMCLNAFAANAGGDAVNHAFYFLLAFVMALVLTVVLGWLLERVAYRPLRKATRLSALITAIGASLFLQNVAAVIWDPSVKMFDAPEFFFESITTFMDGKVDFLWEHLVVFVLVMLSMCLLWWTVEKTKLGKAMRACSQDADAAALMGININKVVAFTFVIGSFMAALSGMLFGFHLGQVRYDMGVQIGIIAFAAAVLGGIGSITGSILGGFIIGFSYALLGGYLTTFGEWIGHPFNAAYVEAFTFMIMIVCLIVKPNGLLGKEEADRA